MEVTDENREASQEAKGKALEALSEGKLDEAIEHLSQAITLNPTSAIMYGNRGVYKFFFNFHQMIFSLPNLSVFVCASASVYIKLKKPNAAIRDANAALEVQ